MFTTIEEVSQLTGYTVTNDTITKAQSIIETYVGKVEVEVSDGVDLALLGKATAYQAAYMFNDTLKIFEQMNTYQISQFGQMVTFQAGNTTSPWVAPLAVLACQRLSWKRLRSIKTGSIFSIPANGTAEDWRQQ